MKIAIQDKLNKICKDLPEEEKNKQYIQMALSNPLLAKFIPDSYLQSK